jgi:hypothetical protein
VTPPNHMPDVDFELDEFTVVVLSEGPRAAELSEAEVKQLLAGHIEHTLGLQAAGHLLAAGALEDAGAEGRLTGLGFSSKPADELRPLVEEDPAVRAGLESFKLVTYRCPKGAVAFGAGAVGTCVEPSGAATPALRRRRTLAAPR